MMHPQNSHSLHWLVAKALLKPQALSDLSLQTPALMPPHGNATFSHGLEAAAPDVPPRSQRERAGSSLH